MITSGFFNSVNGDRLYNAEEMTTYFEGLVSDGVYANVGEGLQVLAAGSGLNITVGTGRALVKMHWIKNDTRLPLTLSAADVQLDRIDAVILRCDLTDSVRDLSIEIKTGTPAGLPAAPEMVNTQTVKEMPLAFIKVPRRATTITQANITDTRPSTLCGWVTGLIEQVDTSNLFMQYLVAYENMLAQMQAWQSQREAAFNLWFQSLTDTLHVDTSIAKFESSYTTTAETKTIPLIPEYAAGDVLLVHINGVLFMDGEEYSVNSNDNTIRLVKSITAGNTVTQILIKSMIGYSVVSEEIDNINGEVI